MRRPYTEEEILRAFELHEKIKNWRIVAERLGRTCNSLSVTISKYKKGKWSPLRRHEQSCEIDRKLEAGVAQGMETRELCSIVGLAKSTVYQRLWRLGFDSETRQESADLVGKVLPGPCFPHHRQ